MDVLNKLARGRANSFEQSRKIFALKDFPRDVYGAQVQSHHHYISIPGKRLPASPEFRADEFEIIAMQK